MSTNLPWHIDPQHPDEIRDAEGSLVLEADPTDGPLIVTAVNAHADLLAAVKKILANHSPPAREWLKAVIRKAEESAP